MSSGQDVLQSWSPATETRMMIPSPTLSHTALLESSIFVSLGGLESRSPDTEGSLLDILNNAFGVIRNTRKGLLENMGNVSALFPIVHCSLVSPGVTRCHKQRLMIMSCWENSSSNQTQVFIYTSNYPALCVHYKALNKDWDEKLKCFCWPSLFRFLNRKIITEAASVKQLLSPPRGHNSCNLHNFARELPPLPSDWPLSLAPGGGASGHQGRISWPGCQYRAKIHSY